MFVKNTILMTLTLFFGSMALMACEKEQSNLTPDEVAVIIEGALMSDSEGAAAGISEAVLIAERYTVNAPSLSCGQTADTTFSRSLSNTRITADYSASVNWTLQCNQFNVPQSIAMNLQSSGNYTTPRVSSNDSGTGSLTVSNLVTGPNFLINGSCTRNGSQTRLLRNGNGATTTVTISLSNVAVSKTTRKIQSGSAEVIINGQGSGGQTVDSTGSIVFNGDGTATLTINGQTYTITLG